MRKGARLATLLTLLLVSALWAPPALARESAGADGPSVLLLDSNLGDLRRGRLRWLGEDVEPTAQEGAWELTRASKPAWWTQTGVTDNAPATFMLSCDDGAPLTAGAISWALDQIRMSGAEPRVFVIAFGETGLPLREYAEDLAETKQSARADLVGAAFCGTPHSGHSIMQTYPNIPLWDTLASSIGASAADLWPTGSLVSKLSEGSLPAVFKTLLVCGDVGDLGFGATDGVCVPGDFVIGEDVTTQIDSAPVRATISQELNLTNTWMPLSSDLDNPGETVDRQLAERLSAISCYENSDEVLNEVREFYDAWFADGAPVTHGSYVMTLDLSGSMLEQDGQGVRKIDSAQAAAMEYLRAMQICSHLPFAAPTDLSILGFNVSVSRIASTYDDAAVAAIGQMSAHDETDMGQALDAAYDLFRSTPICASRRLLLLSDGASTQGKDDGALLAEAANAARELGIVIDAVGFGDTGESNAGFLRQLVDVTGGTYYQANDTYDLKVNFLTSYYSSLGIAFTDGEVGGEDGQASYSLGAIGKGVAALEVGVVTEGGLADVRLMRDGGEVDESLYDVSAENGLVTVSFDDPPAGEYDVSINGVQGKGHVFAVTQQGMSHEAEVVGQQTDVSPYILAVAGIALLTGIALIVARTLSVRHKDGGGA